MFVTSDVKRFLHIIVGAVCCDLFAKGTLLLAALFFALVVHSQLGVCFTEVVCYDVMMFCS